MTLYKRRAGTVEAVYFDGKNQEEVAAFSEGRITISGLVCVDVGPNITYCRPGMYVVRRYGGVAVMSKDEFEAQYEPLLQV